MNTTSFASYAAIALGILACLVGIFLVGHSQMKKSSGHASKTMIGMLLGSGLLFVFGGGWGLLGLTAAGNVLRDLVAVIRGTAGSREHKESASRLLEAARGGRLDGQELALLEAAFLHNPPDDAEDLVGQASEHASGLAKTVLSDLRGAITRRSKDALETATKEVTTASTPTAAVKKLSPEQLRFLHVVPDARLRAASLNKDVIREAMKGK